MKPNTTIDGDETIKVHIVTQEINDFKLAHPEHYAPAL